VPIGTGAHELAVDRARGIVFVASYQGSTVETLNLETRRGDTIFDLAPHASLHGIAASRSGDVVWVTAEEARAILELDARTGSILRAWPTDGYRSHMVAATPDDRKLYVPNLDDGTVSVIDRESEDVRVIAMGGGAEGVAFRPGSREVWVSNRADNTLSIIDTGTDTVVETMASEGSFPVKVRFTPDGGQAWVVNNQSQEVAVFDTGTRTWLGSVRVGVRPLGIAFSEDGSRAFITVAEAGEVVEVDVITRTVVRRFTTGANPDGIAWIG
jgi:YVTN family beta-propeller protein